MNRAPAATVARPERDGRAPSGLHRPPKGRATMSQDKDGPVIAGSARGETEPAPGVPSGAAATVTRRRPIDAGTRARIGRGLRLHYAEVLALPIPERLRTLIDDLAACSDLETPR